MVSVVLPWVVNAVLTWVVSVVLHWVKPERIKIDVSFFSFYQLDPTVKELNTCTYIGTKGIHIELLQYMYYTIWLFINKSNHTGYNTR